MSYDLSRTITVVEGMSRFLKVIENETSKKDDVLGWVQEFAMTSNIPVESITFDDDLNLVNVGGSNILIWKYVIVIHIPKWKKNKWSMWWMI